MTKMWPFCVHECGSIKTAILKIPKIAAPQRKSGLGCRGIDNYNDIIGTYMKEGLNETLVYMA